LRSGIFKPQLLHRALRSGNRRVEAEPAASVAPAASLNAATVMISHSRRSCSKSPPPH
jgi:hypothetical protein